jgi:general transcription factor 3C polypeptide 5 (transcription factor C subunit 1)
LKKFKLATQVDTPPNVDLVPPPLFSNMALPFVYDYNHNNQIREIISKDGTSRLVTLKIRDDTAGPVLAADDEPVPEHPLRPPAVTDPLSLSLLEVLGKIFDQRPLWTRRSLVNQLSKLDTTGQYSGNRIKELVPFVGYQFRGGPFKDVIVKYGVDPRKHSKYREYQTLTFKLDKLASGQKGLSWKDARNDAIKFRKAGTAGNEDTDTHIFDGKSCAQDGKVWQVCDVTDPILATLFSSAPVRPEFSAHHSGWFHSGTWAKARAIMRTKIFAIRFGRGVLPDTDFAAALRVADRSPSPGQTQNVTVPIPDLYLTPAEEERLKGRTYRPPTQEPWRKRAYKRVTYAVALPKRARDPDAILYEGDNSHVDLPGVRLNHELGVDFEEEDEDESDSDSESASQDDDDEADDDDEEEEDEDDNEVDENPDEEDVADADDWDEETTRQPYDEFTEYLDPELTGSQVTSRGR